MNTYEIIRDIAQIFAYTSIGVFFAVLIIKTIKNGRLQTDGIYDEQNILKETY